MNRYHFPAPYHYALILLSFFSCWFREPARAQMNDAAFFGRLNLDYPGMEEVRNAIRNNDYAAAKTAYVQFQRNRLAPTYGVSKDLPSSYPSTQREPLESESEQALRNIFTEEGVSYSFPQRINWRFNPTDERQNPAYQGVYRQVWTVSFNSLSILTDLARSFVETGNPIYAGKIDDLLNQWIDNALFEIPNGEREIWSSAWRTLEAGIRAGETWPETWSRTIKSRELKDETIIKWIKSWLQHADYLAAHTGSLNWLTTESKGLYTVGALFPELNQSKEWRDLALLRLENQFQSDFYPDGAHVELSPEYHRISAQVYAEVYRLALLNDYDIPVLFIRHVESALDYLVQINLPDRNPPRLNDSGIFENLPNILQKWGLEIFPARRDLQWLASEGRQGIPPAYTSTLLPWAGQAVMRNNWSRQGNYLLFEYGPYGEGSHQHEDKLGVHIAGYGEVFVFEAGRENYGESPLRSYCLSSPAHSVITIDRLGQNRESAEADLGRAEAPYPVVWTNRPDFDFASAAYGELPQERYGEEQENRGSWRRHVLFMKPDIFVILDVIHPNDNAAHLYHSYFHLNAADAELDPAAQRISITEKGRPGFSITPLLDGDLQTRIFQGQTSPEILGWELFEVREDRAIPTVRFEKKGKGPIFFAYVFRATPTGRPAPKTHIARLDTQPGVIGVQIDGDLGKTSPFKVLISTDERIDSIEWGYAKYRAPAILIKSSPADVYDLHSGELLSAGAGDLPPLQLSSRPNPADQEVQIIVQSRLEGAFQLQVVDMTGQVVHQNTIRLHFGENVIPLDMRHWPSGAYAYSISDGRVMAAQKMTKIR